MTITFTVATWRKIAERLETDQVQFSTGSQRRAAHALADFISEETSYAPNESDDVTIDFGDNYDAVLSVHQAAY